VFIATQLEELALPYSFFSTWDFLFFHQGTISIVQSIIYEEDTVHQNTSLGLKTGEVYQRNREVGLFDSRFSPGQILWFLQAKNRCLGSNFFCQFHVKLLVFQLFVAVPHAASRHAENCRMEKSITIKY
jgi:hypothetical protein